MKSPGFIINNNLKYEKLLSWGKVIALTGSTQALVQATALISGIVIIRLLPTQEYAWYTLTNSLLGAMALLADGGISTGVMAQGGQVWQNRQKLGVVLATGLELRKKLGGITLLVITPILIYLLLHHGASWLTIVLIIISLIPGFYAALFDSLLEVAPKLNQDIPSIQKNQLLVGISRLILTCLTLIVFPFTYVALMATAIPRIYGNRGMRKISGKFADATEKPDLEIRKNILSIVKRILPGAIYFCLSGQITIWLISIFGNTSSIAEVGALGRLAMLLNVFSVIIATIVVPRFARLANDRFILLSRFLQIIGLLFLLCSGIVAIFWLFPTQILLVLGKKYSGLNNELTVIIIGSCISLIWGTIFNLYSSRGWILNPALSIIVSIGGTVLGIIMFNISTVKGVLSLNIFIAMIELVVHATYAFYKISTLNKHSII